MGTSDPFNLNELGDLLSELSITKIWEFSDIGSFGAITFDGKLDNEKYRFFVSYS